MKTLIVRQSSILGTVPISGAKNAALPLLALMILAKNEVQIGNVPNVADINTMLKLLKLLGSEFSFVNNNLTINTSQISSTTATYDIVKTMRASILTLAPLLARFGECKVSLPGGCAIGLRPVDLHLKALAKMGADIKIENGYIHAVAKEGLKGCEIVFDKITVTGTENIIMAAVLADGVTKILNAAKEPEVVQLCEVLRDNGVEIAGIGTSSITIRGYGELLEIAPFDVIPDRIEAGTYLCAGAIANSKITVENVVFEHMENIVNKLKEMNFDFEITSNKITILPTTNINPVNIITSEHPGFPTDMQAQFMAVATQADGVSTIEEKLFENRFMHVAELNRLGANIKINAKVATIYGPTKLVGADVMATDLRASSALVLGGIIAEGETRIHRVYHLFRGYENLVEKLNNIGVDVELIDEEAQ
ncbi:MAG: UDP-N-acetylglucosamine 1-carboxyvinyltransferase [Epsilonproteobacteria bacterium]|nr:UDP-N-acetylglucosamine 1-carboxyvinyltransferase [Campylobacterota bacterium]